MSAAEDIRRALRPARGHYVVVARFSYVVPRPVFRYPLGLPFDVGEGRASIAPETPIPPDVAPAEPMDHPEVEPVESPQPTADLGEALRGELRAMWKASGLSQRALAAAIGADSRSRVDGILRGLVTPTPEEIDAWRSACSPPTAQTP